MSRLRVATIGAGYFSQFHYDAWRRLPVDVVGVCDLDETRAGAIAAGFPGARAFTDATQMLEQTAPELLARIIHEHFAADADLPVSAALGLPRVLDVPSRYACAPRRRPPCIYRHLHALASRVHE